MMYVYIVKKREKKQWFSNETCGKTLALGLRVEHKGYHQIIILFLLLPTGKKIFPFLWSQNSLAKKKGKKKKNHNYLVTNVFLYASYTVCVNNYAYAHTIIQLFSASNRSGSFDTIQAYWSLQTTFNKCRESTGGKRQASKALACW